MRFGLCAFHVAAMKRPDRGLNHLFCPPALDKLTQIPGLIPGFNVRLARGADGRLSWRSDRGYGCPVRVVVPTTLFSGVGWRLKNNSFFNFTSLNDLPRPYICGNVLKCLQTTPKYTHIINRLSHSRLSYTEGKGDSILNGFTWNSLKTEVV